MPIYEYQCAECSRTFEYMQSMRDDPKTVCEECGGALSKLISAAAFHLKGGGWYKDLYSSPKPGSGGDSSDSGGSSSVSKPSSSDTGSSSSSDSKSSSSSDSSSPSPSPSSSSSSSGKTGSKE